MLIFFKLLLLLPTQTLHKPHFCRLKVKAEAKKSDFWHFSAQRRTHPFIGCSCYCCFWQTNSSGIPTLSVKFFPLGTIPRERHGPGSPSGFPQRMILFLVCHICCPPDYKSAILWLTCGWHPTSGTLCTLLLILSTFIWNLEQVLQIHFAKICNLQKKFFNV